MLKTLAIVPVAFRPRCLPARRGSVLIMVVALLVLLALIGTAWLATARIDRVATGANADKVPVEALVQSVQQTIIQAVFDDLTGRRIDSVQLTLTGPMQFKPREDYDQCYTHQPWTCATDSPLDGAVTSYLASRVPEVQWFTTPPAGVPDAQMWVYWPAISRPLIPGVDIESPLVNTGTTPPVRANMAPWPSRPYRVEPSSVVISYPEGPKRFPAFRLRDPASPDRILGLMLAGDADGDGIADSGLWRLPGAEQNGITYYAAVRVIDNNSAVNASVAWEPYRLPIPPATLQSGELPVNFFPTNIDLSALVRVTPGAPLAAQEMERDLQMNRLNNFRFHFDFAAHPLLQPTTSIVPIDDFAKVRRDLMFLYSPRSNNRTPYDADRSYEALWMQLGRRLENPGYNMGRDLTGRQDILPYRALNIADQISLARGFVVPTVGTDPGTGQIVALPNSVLEASLDRTLLQVWRLNPNNGQYAMVSGPQQAYRADEVAQFNSADPNFGAGWWYENFRYFDFGNFNGFLRDTYSRRPLLVARNPVSMQIPPASALRPEDPNGPTAPIFPPDLTLKQPKDQPQMSVLGREQANGYFALQDAMRSLPPVKANVNTAPFAELWRAYWNVMVGRSPAPTANGDTTFFAPEVDNWYNSPRPAQDKFNPFIAKHPARMFRSPIRDTRAPATIGTAYMAPSDVMLMRAALAAMNTIQLRRGDLNSPDTIRMLPTQPFVRPITIEGQQEMVRVFLHPVRPQVYITEVFVQIDPANYTPPGPAGAQPNVNGYWAIELHNPHSFAIDLRDWKIVSVDRPTLGMNYVLKVKDVHGFNASTIVPANGYVVLENFQNNNPNNSANYLPSAANRRTGTVTTVVVKNLPDLMGKEMVILRPGFNPSIAPDRADGMMPVDQFDFTGLAPPPQNQLLAWHYARASGPNAPWQFVYPGKYDGSKATLRQQGTIRKEWPASSATDPWDTSIPNNTEKPITLGGPSDEDQATYPKTNRFKIQLVNNQWPGPNAPALVNPPATTPNWFPYGGFARDGDILQVPFIGAYTIERITKTGTEIIELNAVTMDSVFAEDSYDDDNDREAVGRFCPIPPVATQNWNNTANAWDDPAAGGTQGNDFVPDTIPSDNARRTRWRYRWAMRLFDYLTTQTPSNDFMPNTPLENPGINHPAYNQTPPTSNDPNRRRHPVANSDPNQPNMPSERLVGVEGLININTAPAVVLATLPMIPADFPAAGLPAGHDYRSYNTLLARLIAHYRDIDDGSGKNRGHGAFKNIFELYQVPEFRKAAMVLCKDAAEPGLLAGDITRTLGLAPAAYDGVRDDFEEQFLLLNRISNMITVRSDTFTCYILIQGWKDAGTARPELVYQRRAGLILDRTGVSGLRPDQRNIKVIPFEVN